MSNELTIQGQRPDYLPALPTDKGGSKFTSGISAGGLALPRLSFRGKVFRLRKDGEEVPLGQNSLEVILVDARTHLSKAYYDKPYTPGEITAPRCFAPDGQNPISGEDGKEPIASSCSQCPMNQWGSAVRNGVATKGKACSDNKRLVVYPIIGNGDSRMVQAVVLDLPPTSTRAKKGSAPAFYECARTLEQNGVDPSTYVCELTFDDAAESPRLVWKPKRYATKDEYEEVLAMQESDEVAEVISTDGGVHDSNAAPMETKGEPPVAEPKVEEPPKEEPKPEEPPKEEAKAEAPATDDAAALMEQMKKLLEGK